MSETYLLLNVVDDPEKLLKKGDAWPYMNTELGWLQLCIVCPGCGQQSASAGKHKYNPETMTYTPSIIHDPAKGGCGWHGWLTNGVFKKC